MPADELPRLKDLAASIGVPQARRHIFLCADQTNPKCCDRERSIEAWEFLKKETLSADPKFYRYAFK